MTKILTTIVLALAAVGFSAPSAEAKATPCYVAPTHSASATHCRAKGWILRHGLRVDPHAVLSFAALPKCRAARTTSCWANFDRAQYGEPTYWLDARGRQRFVWMEDPRLSGRRVDATQTARWLTSGERASLSTAHGHTPRWWTACVTDGAEVRCPDGSVW